MTKQSNRCPLHWHELCQWNEEGQCCANHIEVCAEQEAALDS